MDTLKQFPERIISGFAHLVWIILLIMCILEVKPIDIFTKFQNITGGAAALIASLIIGASFFIGNLFDRIITFSIEILMKCRNKPKKPISDLSNECQKDHPEEILFLKNSYIDKAFFRSIGFAVIPIIIISLILNSKYGSINYFWTIIIVGLMIDIASWIISFNLKNKYSKSHDKLKQNSTKKMDNQ